MECARRLSKLVGYMPRLAARGLQRRDDKAHGQHLALERGDGVAVVRDIEHLAVLEDGEVALDGLVGVEVEPEARGQLLHGDLLEGMKARVGRRRVADFVSPIAARRPPPRWWSGLVTWVRMPA